LSQSSIAHPTLLHSYKCTRPQSAAPKLQDKHPKQDYSHVMARVDTGRGQAGMRKAQVSDGEVSSGRRISTGSDEVCTEQQRPLWSTFHMCCYHCLENWSL